MEKKLITNEMISDGLDAGIVKLVAEPITGTGTVCQIGSYWFYFGGLTAEEESPEDYRTHVPKEDIVEEIVSALDGFRYGDPEAKGRYRYFYFILIEQLEIQEDQEQDDWDALQRKIELLRLKAAEYKAYAHRRWSLGRKLERQVERNEDALASGFEPEQDNTGFLTLEDIFHSGQLDEEEYQFCNKI